VGGAHQMPEDIPEGTPVWIPSEDGAYTRVTWPVSAPTGCSTIVRTPASSPLRLLRRPAAGGGCPGAGNAAAAAAQAVEGDVQLAEEFQSEAGLDDNTMLMHLSEPNLLENLRRRFQQDQIYVRTQPWVRVRLSPIAAPP
jgi:hypothetical protein